jgi:membrane-bound lytic murein transglycosylase D
MMHLLLVSLVALLSLASCALVGKGSKSLETSAAKADSLANVSATPESAMQMIRAIRWHLLRASEARNSSLFPAAQRELDLAFNRLGQFDTEDDAHREANETADTLRREVEEAYLSLVPHLEHFSADSPLVLLLEGISEAELENLPKDASPFVRIHQLSRRCDMPIDANARVAASIRFFQTKGRQTYMNWYKRSWKYRDLIHRVLAAEGLPQDLLYLAMIESGFNPKAYSRAHAAGMWQFMESTGRLEGLSRTHWIDERRDPLKSTRAAARHLKRLHTKFGDWRLAIAAYNAGPNRVRRAIKKQDTRDYWNLDLPRETRNYVPLFMAATIVSKAPELFGFTGLQRDSPLAFEQVELPNPLSLNSAAKCARTTRTTLRQLNPELRRGTTPPQRTYDLRVPVGKAEGFLDCYQRLPAHEKQVAWFEYTVRPNDNISTIASEFGVKPGVVANANNLRNPNRIFPGQRLHIPSGQGSGSRKGSSAVYIVRLGDSLSSIALRLGLKVKQLRRLNRLNGDLIVPGQRLALRATPKRNPRLLSSPSAVSETYTVRRGETLWGIAAKLGLRLHDLKTWNDLDGDAIFPGQELALHSGNAELYTVVKGDTLYGIARKFGVQAKDLARRNNISLNSTLLAGMKLEVSSSTTIVD